MNFNAQLQDRRYPLVGDLVYTALTEDAAQKGTVVEVHALTRIVVVHWYGGDVEDEYSREDFELDEQGEWWWRP